MAAIGRALSIAALALLAAGFAGMVYLSVYPSTWWGITQATIQADREQSVGWASFAVALSSMILIGLRRRKSGAGYWVLLTVMVTTLVVGFWLIHAGFVYRFPAYQQ